MFPFAWRFGIPIILGVLAAIVLLYLQERYKWKWYVFCIGVVLFDVLIAGVAVTVWIDPLLPK